jgi:GT2 family glycosyltransferase
MSPTASVIFPTRNRRDYLAVALASVAPQAREHGAEVIVVEDDPEDPATRALAQEHGARYVAHGAPLGINRARNTGLDAATSDLFVLLDDDVEAWPGWLAALLAGARENPDHEALGGPIRPRLEHTNLHACGREPLPVTSLDLGPADRDADFVWGANLALRRSAVDRIGRFDPALNWAGDEEDWQRRLKAAGGRVRYIAGAGVDHRRAPQDARIGALARAAYHRGRASRRWDRAKAAEPSLPTELRVLAGCAWHTARRRCGNGIVMAAHSAGRLHEALRPTQREAAATAQPATPALDFASGESGTLNRRTTLTGAARDAVADTLTLPRRAVLDVTARRAPHRRVLALAITRAQNDAAAAAAARELQRSKAHDVEVHLAPAHPGAGKWANLNAALAAHPVAGHDWLLLFDDDVVLPHRFLDSFVFLCERYGFTLAQPAHKARSNAAWRVTRRRPAAVARRTRFVEIGPVTAIHARAFETLLPFPDLQMGWGLDAHWAAVAQLNDWKVGVVDATPIRHTRPVAGDYPRAAAEAEALAFLADRLYLRREQAQETLEAHARWR